MQYKTIAALCLAIVVSLLSVSGVSAVSFQGNDAVNIKTSDIIDGTLYASGKKVTVDGIVRGDVFCAGETIAITGHIEGDVICAGQDVTISGEVMGSIRIASSRLDVNGTVGRGITAFAQTVQLNASAHIGKDVSIWATTAKVEGSVGRDLVGGARYFTIASKIGRDVTLWTDSVSLTPKAEVAGNFTYTSNQVANNQPGAIVRGEITHTVLPAKTSRGSFLVAGAVLGGIFWFFATALLGGLIILVRSSFLPTTTAIITKEPWATLGWGFVGLVGAPVLAVVAMISLVGIPIGFIIILFWMLALCLGTLLGAHAMGWLICSKLKVNMHRHPRLQQLAALLLGLLVLVLVGLVPFIGGLVSFLVMVWGIGSLLAGFKKVNKKAEAKL